MSSYLFVKEADFAEYTKGKAVKSYNNPWIKCVAGVDVNIIPTDEVVTFKKMTREDIQYYIGDISQEVYEGRTKIRGWFPTELVCGTIGSQYSMNTELAKRTGWIPTNGCFGSQGDAFLASGVKVAADLLEQAGFKVVFE